MKSENFLNPLRNSNFVINFLINFVNWFNFATSFFLQKENYKKFFTLTSRLSKDGFIKESIINPNLEEISLLFNMNKKY